MNSRKPGKQSGIFMASVSQDAAAVQPLARALESRGLTVWSHAANQVSDEAADAMEKALNRSGAFVFVLSPAALESSALYVLLGVAIGRTGRQDRLPILSVTSEPVDLDNVPAPLRNRPMIDARGLSPDALAAEVIERLERQTN